MLGIHQERLPKELAARGIETISIANRYLAARYRPVLNAEFAVPAAEAGTAFVPFFGPGLADILCGLYGRTVGRDICVSFENRKLQVPAQAHRRRFIKVRVRVHRYPDGRPATFHGPRKLADYLSDGPVVITDPAADVGWRGWAERDECDLVEMWTSTSGRMDRSWTTPGVDHRLPTLAPLAHDSTGPTPTSFLLNLVKMNTGQFHLSQTPDTGFFLTGAQPHDIFEVTNQRERERRKK